MKSSQIKIGEYNPYFKQYIDLVDDISLIQALEIGHRLTEVFFEAIPELKYLYKYSIGKWTPQEILLHIIDTERIFCYRALSIARAKNPVLESFDENIFAKNSNANNRKMQNLLEEFIVVRNGTVILFKSFTEKDLQKIGQVNNHSLSIRAIGFIICGHERHHRNIIKERYL